MAISPLHSSATFDIRSKHPKLRVPQHEVENAAGLPIPALLNPSNAACLADGEWVKLVDGIVARIVDADLDEPVMLSAHPVHGMPGRGDLQMSGMIPVIKDTDLEFSTTLIDTGLDYSGSKPCVLLISDGSPGLPATGKPYLAPWDGLSSAYLQAVSESTHADGWVTFRRIPARLVVPSVVV